MPRTSNHQKVDASNNYRLHYKFSRHLIGGPTTFCHQVVFTLASVLVFVCVPVLSVMLCSTFRSKTNCSAMDIGSLPQRCQRQRHRRRHNYLQLCYAAIMCMRGAIDMV